MADEGVGLPDRLKLLTDNYFGVGRRLKLARLFEPERELWGRCEDTVGGECVRWIRRALYFDAVLGVHRSTWAKPKSDVALERLIEDEVGVSDASKERWGDEFGRDRWRFKRLDVFRARYAAHLAPMPRTLQRHIKQGGGKDDFDVFFSVELHDDWRASFDLFNQVHAELTGDKLDLEDHMQIAEAQAEAFVAAISRPSDEVFENALDALRPPSPFDDVFGE